MQLIFYADENHGRFPEYINWSGYAPLTYKGAVSWFAILHGVKDPHDPVLLKLRNASSCPAISYDPTQGYHLDKYVGQVFGMVAGADGVRFHYGSCKITGNGAYGFSKDELRKFGISGLPMLADSLVRKSSPERQYCGIEQNRIWGLDSIPSVHLRHNRFANITYLDGHVGKIGIEKIVQDRIFRHWITAEGIAQNN